MKQNYHLPIIDTLRGVAAMSVCLFHYVCCTENYVKDKNILNIFSFGDYGVQVFFIISGIVIPLSMLTGNYTYESWLQFLKRRFIRIEPPYLISLLVAAFYLHIRNFIPGISNSEDLTPTFSAALLHLGYMVPFVEGTKWINPVCWTLAIEFQYYVCLALLFPLAISGDLKKRILFYLILCLPHLLSISNTNVFIIYWFPLFLMGIVYALWRFKKIEILEYATVTFFASVFVIYYIGWMDWIFGAATLLVVYFFEGFKTPLTKFLGDISYSIYLMHTITGGPVVKWLSHRYQESYQKVIVILLGIAISMITAYVMYRTVELPAKKWASQIKYKSST